MTARRRKIPDLSDAEEAAVQVKIASDPDAPEATDEQLAMARPFKNVFPDMHEAARRGRGRPKTGKARQIVSIRLDPDVVEKFRSTGPGWHRRINDVLKRAKIG